MVDIYWCSGGRGGRSGDVMWLGWERGEEVVKI